MTESPVPMLNTVNWLADFARRTAAIAGGAKGIGLATARRLAAAGTSVALWDIDEGALAQARGGFSPDASVVTERVDVTDAADVVRAAAKMVSQLGKIDISRAPASPVPIARRGSIPWRLGIEYCVSILTG